MGNGEDIVIGYDPVIGSSSCLFFDQDFRSYLRDYGIQTLQHAQNPFVDSQSFWLTADDLELGVNGGQYGSLILRVCRTVASVWLRNHTL